jgi:hypothetical protein
MAVIKKDATPKFAAKRPEVRTAVALERIAEALARLVELKEAEKRSKRKPWLFGPG